MTKLPKNKKFIDVSDYARPFALILVKLLLPTKIGAYILTSAFLVVGIAASYLIIINQYIVWAAILILVKSMLDAADGEIARQRNELSMVGRYFDSISDFIINLLLFVSIAYVFNVDIWIILLSLIMFQLQGSLYNYYYLIKRYQVNGDKTSRIFEREEPKPFPKDNHKLLKVLHKVYLVIYGWQDYLVYKLDQKAIKTNELPNWFLTMASFLGLGFQLLIIAFLILLNEHNFIFIIFIVHFSIFAFVLILVRRLFIK